MITFDLNILYGSQILRLLEYKLKLWNFQVLNYQELESHGEIFSMKAFQSFANILNCYHFYIVGFQQYVRLLLVLSIYETKKNHRSQTKYTFTRFGTFQMLLYMFEVMHSLFYAQLTIDS